MSVQIDRARLVRHLEALLAAHAPSGSEAEMDALVKEMTHNIGDAVWQDAADNIIVHLSGRSSHAPIGVTAHKDEIAMIVKRVEEDGRLRVRPIGGLHPWAVGESPVEILGRHALVPGVLSIGAKHVSTESPAGRLKEGQGLTWETMWIETKLSREELENKGVRPGTKAVIARPRKSLWHMGGFVCGYNLDCRAGLAMLIEVALHLRQERPAQDVYLIASSSEEIGGQGAAYSLGQLPVDTAIAIDIIPVAQEYGTRNCGDPILGVQDSRGVYHERILAHLEGLAARQNCGIQTAVLTSYASDASIARSIGVVARSALIGYPGDNTHGFEICSVEGMVNAARLLLAYLRDPLV